MSFSKSVLFGFASYPPLKNALCHSDGYEQA